MEASGFIPSFTQHFLTAYDVPGAVLALRILRYKKQVQSLPSSG